MLLHYQEFGNNVEKNKYKMTDLRDLIKDYKIKVKCHQKTDAIEHIYLFLEIVLRYIFKKYIVAFCIVSYLN